MATIDYSFVWEYNYSMGNDGLITTSEAAKILGCTNQYVRFLARTGQLSATKRGRDWIINQNSINDLQIKQHTRPLFLSRKPGRPPRINIKPIIDGRQEQRIDVQPSNVLNTSNDSITLEVSNRSYPTNTSASGTKLLDDKVYINRVFYKSSKQMTEIPNESVHLIITSPPYFNIKDYSKDGYQDKSIGVSHEDQIGDINNYRQYIQELLIVWKECERVLKPNGKLAINVPLLPMQKKHLSTHHNRHIFDINSDIEHSIINETKLYLMDMYIWNRTNPAKRLMFGSYPFPRNFYAQNTIEFITVYVKDGKPPDGIPMEMKLRSKLSEKEWTDYTKQVWNIPIPGKNDLGYGKHAAIMPEEIVRRSIKLFTFEGDVVLDPFAGSGTTFKVAKELNRNYVGYEISDGYKEVIEAKLASTKMYKLVEKV